VELEVGMVERELGKDRLVVAKRLACRAELVAEPADEVGDLEADRRRPVGLVLHGLPHDPGGLSKRQARASVVRAAPPVVREEQVGPCSLCWGRRFGEKLELASQIDRGARFLGSDCHSRKLPDRGRQSLARNSPTVAAAHGLPDRE
jgi:hypothetical protein